MTYQQLAMDLTTYHNWTIETEPTHQIKRPDDWSTTLCPYCGSADRMVQCDTDILLRHFVSPMIEAFTLPDVPDTVYTPCPDCNLRSIVPAQYIPLQEPLSTWLQRQRETRNQPRTYWSDYF